MKYTVVQIIFHTQLHPSIRVGYIYVKLATQMVLNTLSEDYRLAASCIIDKL